MIDRSAVSNRLLRPRLCHRPSADAAEGDIRSKRTQCAHQCAAERVAGFFRRDEKQFERTAHRSRRFDADDEDLRLVGRRGDRGRLGDDRAACDHRDAGKPGARDLFDGARPDRREIEAAVLLRLRRLDQHARCRPGQQSAPARAIRRCAEASRRCLRSPQRQGRDCQPRSPPVPCRTGRWPRARQAPARCPPHRAARDAELPIGPSGIRMSGATSCGADDAKSIVLENARDVRDQMIVAAAIGAHDPRQQPQGQPVDAQRAKRRAQRRADENDIPAAFRPRVTQEKPGLGECEASSA